VKLVVGLGNPGPEYEWTPHNLGFHVVERLAREQGLIFEPAARLGGWTGRLDFEAARDPRGRVLLVKPLCWMNRSGRVVAPLVAWCGSPPEELFVVYDDIDLEPGVLRIRPHGGAGGHRGVQSIVDELGTDRFPRLRVGVGRPRTDAARHVLESLSERERTEAEITVADAADALAWWLAEGDLERCMTRFHSRWKEGRPR
jgi:PTH1 family peptidyl-tRNA hydrolase